MSTLTDTVSLERHGDVAVIIVCNPPVNAISASVRDGIGMAADQLTHDKAARAVVLHCAGSTFMTGADIRRFARPAVPARASADIMGAIESLTTPVVAALQGNTLGGGLEFALSCHYRCALPATKLGVPEVNLGLIPGAGGTQRLPRLLGIGNALELIVSGKPVSAARALEMGLIDRIVDGDLLDAAIAYARELVACMAAPRRCRELAVPMEGREAAFTAAATLAAKTRKDEPAALRGIEAVRAATTLTFADGLAVEARLFVECRDSAQSRALRHLFSAERQISKLTGIENSGPLRLIKTVGVVGAGTMGRGIAMAMANAAFDVRLIENNADALERAKGAIKEVYDASVAKRRLTTAERDASLARIHGGLNLEQLSTTDLVIEAVFEDLPLKQQVFRDLDRICRPGAILATNTSAIDVDRIASATQRPEDVVGLHFFTPAQVMRLLEVVRGAKTGADVLATSMHLARTLRKLGVLAGNCDGFIGNRMLIGYRREAEFLLLEGASPSDVDRALLKFGMAMGPLTMGDMGGLDISAAGRKRRRAEGKLPNDPRFGAVPDRLVEHGRFGQKTGAGYYRYEAGSYRALPDPAVDALLAAEAKRLGVPRRSIAAEEIIARCIYPLINEGARILDEGMAQRPGDIDVVWTSGYGFPRTRGGPLCYADEVGLPAVLATLRNFERELGSMYWTPASLLIRLTEEGKSFGSLNN